MPDTLTCPVCTTTVAASSSMCFSCHLPIKDVNANQPQRIRAPKARAASRWVWTRLLGSSLYGAAVAWCALQMPTSLTFVVPAAVLGVFLHVVRGRPWLGLFVFLLVVAVLPLLFWPSMMTDTLARLTDW